MQEALPTFLLIGGMFVVMYFLMIRPQQQKARAHQDMVNALSRGDHVILQGGLYGKITKVHEETIEVEIADGVTIRQVKSMVLALDTKPEPAKKKAPAKSTAKSTAKTPTRKPRTPKAKTDEGA